MAQPTNMPEFGKVVVFGVGLIGGSFALALKAAGQVEEVVGFGRSLGTLKQALDLGIIDRIGANPGQEVADADLVLIATPVGQMPEIMARIAPYLGAETVVTDGGSTKSDVVAAARAAFGDRIGQWRREQRRGGGEGRPLPRTQGGADGAAGEFGVERRPRAFRLGVVRRPDFRTDAGRARPGLCGGQPPAAPAVLRAGA